MQSNNVLDVNSHDGLFVLKWPRFDDSRKARMTYNGTKSSVENKFKIWNWKTIWVYNNQARSFLSHMCSKSEKQM